MKKSPENLRISLLALSAAISSILFARGIAYPQEIATTPIYGVRQSEALILELEPFQCSSVLSIFERTYRCDPNGRLIIGADIQQGVGSYRLGSTDIVIDVVPGHFPKPVYRKRGSGKPINEEKRKAEIALMEEAFTAGPENYPDYTAQGTFNPPVKQVTVTDVFGLQRLLYRKNKKDARSSWHRGVDLRARPVGRPVHTIGPGVVMLAHYFKEGGEGKMLVIYHGSNIYSLYLHLNEFRVKTGDMVGKGQVVALSGKTGTSTPHLHFAMKVNTKTVDPLKFIEVFNASLGS